LFCEQVIEEKDDRLSLFRLTTEIEVKIAGADVPTAMPTMNLPINGLIVVNAGPGSYKVRMSVFSPSGRHTEGGPESHVDLTHDTFTVNVFVKAMLQVSEAGTYWFRVWIDDRKVTRTPLAIRYVPTLQQTSTQSGETASPPASRH
jgi:hypothetical protein